MIIKASPILRTSALAFGLRVLGNAFAFIFSILIARFLGVDGAGVYYLAATVVTVSTTLSRIGLDNSLLRFASAASENADWGTVKALYKKSAIFAVTAGGLVSFTVFFLTPWFAQDVFDDYNLIIPLRILSLSILPLSLIHLHAELLKALRRIPEAMLLQGIAYPCTASIFLVILAGPFKIIGAATGSALASFLVMSLGIYLWRKKIPSDAALGSFSTRKLLATSLPLFIVGLMNIIIDFSDTLMIGYFLNSAAVGVYVIALRVTGLCSLFLTAVNSVVAPEFSSLWDKNKKEELQTIARHTTIGMAILAFLLFAIFVSFPETILSLFGPDFIKGKSVLVILAFGQLVALGTGPVAYLLMMTGHEKFHRNNVACCAVLNIILNLVLIPFMGIPGAAVATATSLTIKNIVAVIFVRSKLGIKVLI